MPIPSINELNETRLSKFKQAVSEATSDDSLESLMPIVESLQQETEASPERLIAALIKLAQGDEPLLLKESDRPDLHSKPQREDRGDRGPRDRGDRGPRGDRGDRRGKRASSKPEAGMQRYRIDVGHTHGAKPGNIVGAIANEGNINSKNIGAIEIYDKFSTVDLPQGMPRETKELLQNTRVAGQKLSIREWSDTPPKRRAPRKN